LEARPNDLTVDYIIRKGEGESHLDFMGSDRDDLSLIRLKEMGKPVEDITTT
jgi:hypothetical protein